MFKVSIHTQGLKYGVGAPESQSVFYNQAVIAHLHLVEQCNKNVCESKSKMRTLTF